MGLDVEGAIQDHLLPGFSLTYGCFDTIPAYPFAIDAFELCTHGRLSAPGARFRRFDAGFGRQFHLHRFNGEELIIRHFQHIETSLNVKFMKSHFLFFIGVTFHDFTQKR